MRLLLPLVASSLLLAAPAGAFVIMLDNFTNSPVTVTAVTGATVINDTRTGFFSPLASSATFSVGSMIASSQATLATPAATLQIAAGAASMSFLTPAVSAGSQFNLTYSGISSNMQPGGALLLPISSANGTWALDVNINGNITSFSFTNVLGRELRILTPGSVSAINSINIMATLVSPDPLLGAGMTLTALTLVPEPSRALLLLGGLAPLALRRRRRS